MISIIISTYRPDYLKSLKRNIQQTIGVEFEIIAIDNSCGKKGLCEVYNEGAEKARFGILCFIHEDVEIITFNWGILLKELFDSNVDIGVVGVAGSKIKLSIPSGWTTFDEQFDRFNVYHSSKPGDKDLSRYYCNPEDEEKSNVVVLDGVFMSIRKSVWEKVKFDEQIKGFHFYDIDYTMSVLLSGYKACVFFKLSLIHYSAGKFNNSWANAALSYYRKRKNMLREINVLQRGPAINEMDIKKKWLERLLTEDISIINRIRIASSFGLYKSPCYLNSVMKFLTKKSL